MQIFLKNKWSNIFINGKKKSRMLLLLAVLLTVEIVAIAQSSGTGYLVFNVNIPEVALLDIEPAGNTEISLIIAPPGEAGKAPVLANSSNNSLWLNYTNSRSANGPFRKVNVQLHGSLPPGIAIRLKASPRSGLCGSGMFGIPNDEIVLSNTPQILISGIGGSFTGDGAGCGHRLNYTFTISESELLQYTLNAVIQVTYTLADN
jgi:hypothetical protein